MKQIQFGCLAVAAVLGLGVAQSASAADMPFKAPAQMAAPNWTGFYVGGSLGGRWDSSTWTTTSLGAGAFPADIGNNPSSFSNGSARFGGYLGYNWQVAPRWVVGIEGDYAWANNKSQVTNGIPGTFVPPFTTGDYAERKDKWDAGVRVRLGYLINSSTLLFATGGASWMGTESTAACGTPQLWCTGTNNTTHRVDTVSKTVVGWTIGAGVEWMVAPNWLVRGEYRYAAYQSQNVRLLQGGGTVFNSDTLDASIGSIHTHTALFGVAYKFGQ